MTLGEVIKEYREKHNMSMGEFAEISKMSKAYVSLLEKGNRKNGNVIAPSNKIMKQAADAMCMSMSELRSKIEPLDWNDVISDEHEPTTEDIELIDELWREEQEIADMTRSECRLELLKIMSQLSIYKLRMLVDYARYLMKGVRS